jgi:hypothetical protein
MTAAIVILALAAVGGVALALQRFKGGSNPSLGVAAIHGLAAAVGLVLVLVAVLGGSAASPAPVGLVLLVLAALGGFVLIAQHLRGKLIPMGLVVGHALAAVAGFVVLLVAVL